MRFSVSRILKPDDVDLLSQTDMVADWPAAVERKGRNKMNFPLMKYVYINKRSHHMDDMIYKQTKKVCRQDNERKPS